MSNNPDVINLVSSRQYKSISNIEILSNLSVMKEFDYDYKLNLQTKDKLSRTFDIFMSKSEISENFIDPIKELIQRHKQPILDPIITLTKNLITPNILSYYSINSLLPDSKRERIKPGCTEYLIMKFTLEDNLFIHIDCKTSYRYFLFKHKPKVIQPERILLTLDDAEYLISTFECLHKS